MRRTLLAAALVLTALMGLWLLWAPPEPEGIAANTPEEVARPAAQRERTRAVTTHHAPALPEVEEELKPMGEVLPDEAAAVAEAYGAVWFVVETESGERVQDWFVDSPDCGLTWTSRLAEVPMRAPGGDCTFRALRLDGKLKTRSAGRRVQIRPGEEVEVALALPDERTGGLGIYIQEHELGIAVQGVMPGTPAAELGLEFGDLIVEVDGASAAELEMEDFVDSMTGPEGSEVEFTLAYEGDTGLVYEDLTLVRAFLEDGDGAPDFEGARFAGRAIEAIEDRDQE